MTGVQTCALPICFPVTIVCAVVTSAGEEIPATLVGMCIGIRPNVKWLEGSGVVLEQGCIRVNEYLQTNIPNIYGAGDCTIIRPLDAHLHTSNMVGYRANRTWQVATNQGLCAANNMFSDHGGVEGQGEHRPYDEGMFYNAGVLYDLPYTMLGLFNPGPDMPHCQTYIYDTAGDPFAYFKLTVSAGRLVGAMLIGKQRRTNILRRIMEGHYIVTGHEHELMDTKFKPNDLPVPPELSDEADTDEPVVVVFASLSVLVYAEGHVKSIVALDFDFHLISPVYASPLNINKTPLLSNPNLTPFLS